jgi:hypothetical protein
MRGWLKATNVNRTVTPIARPWRSSCATRWEASLWLHSRRRWIRLDRDQAVVAFKRRRQRGASGEAIHFDKYPWAV